VSGARPGLGASGGDLRYEKGRVRFRHGAVLAALALAACSAEPDRPAVSSYAAVSAARSCIAGALTAVTVDTVPIGPVHGPGRCGAIEAYSVTALGFAGDPIVAQPAATLSCGMIPALDRWVAESVQAAAMVAFGSEVERVSVASSYMCRAVARTSRLSEHGLANAIDISAFTLENGREITVADGWRGAPEERLFLHAIYNAACGVFETVLGPDDNADHRDHLHLDMADRGPNSTFQTCT